MKLYIAQINNRVGDIDFNKNKILSEFVKAKKSDSDLIVFCEMALTGYNCKDLWLKESFLEKSNKALQEIILASKNEKCAILVGAPYQEKQKNKIFLYNAAFLIEDGEIKNIIKKKTLPNYGVFDEKRYFKSSDLLSYVEFRGFTFAVMICEDLWDLKNQFLLNEQVFDCLISINSSPYERQKNILRKEIIKKLAKKINKPIIYLNQVGGQDHLVFDGSSLIYDILHDKEIFLQEFKEDYKILDFEKSGEMKIIEGDKIVLSDDLSRDYKAIILGLRDYVKKSGFEKVILGLSGGIDSALVAVMAVDAFGKDNVALFALPSRFNSEESMDDAKKLANNLEIELEIIAIEDTVQALNKTLEKQNISDLAQENIQSRIRGNILMALSNSGRGLLLSTGNKSELAVGYATIYGDMCGAYNPLKDLYKSEVYKLSNWRNKNIVDISLFKRDNLIPQNIIKKEPSAELRDNQKDSDSLPDYEILDKILYFLIEEAKSVENIIKMGYDADLVKKIAILFKNSEYKRKQAVMGAKISKMSFDEDRRYAVVDGFISNL